MLTHEERGSHSLSAQRSRRTTLRCLKGLLLEVRAQNRRPLYLVVLNISKCNILPLQLVFPNTFSRAPHSSSHPLALFKTSQPRERECLKWKISSRIIRVLFSQVGMLGQNIEYCWPARKSRYIDGQCLCPPGFLWNISEMIKTATILMDIQQIQQRSPTRD